MHKEGNANRSQYLPVDTLINFRYVGKSTKITLKETASTFATSFMPANVTLERTPAGGGPLWDAATASANTCVCPKLLCHELWHY
jgi:hypothetical protein